VRFLLDANVLVDFQSAELLPTLMQASHRVSMAVAENVFDEVTLPKTTDSSEMVGKKRLAATAFLQSKIDKIEIYPGTPSTWTSAATLMQGLLALRVNAKLKDHGEAASIAVAASDANLLFVTGDKNAVWWALNELFHTGERIMLVPVFIRKLFESLALDANGVRRVASRATSHGPVPSWWASWLAGLSRL
jgi:hypothetical protein